MNKLVALLCVAFANVLLSGQTLSPGQATAPDTVEQLAKKFPPELVVPIAPSPAATLLRSSCVYPSLDLKSISVQPCRTNSPRLRLVPPFEMIAPPAKPGTLPDNIR